MKLKKWIARPWALIALFGVITYISLLFGATYVERYTVTGTEVWRIDNDGSATTQGNMYIDDDDLFYGDGSTYFSTTTTGGVSQGQIYTAYLTGDTSAQEGICLSAVGPVTATGITVQVSTAADQLQNIIGIAQAAAATGSAVNFYVSGLVNALTTSTVNSGDLLVTTASSKGYLAKMENPDKRGAVVAVCLSTGPTEGGLIKVRIAK